MSAGEWAAWVAAGAATVLAVVACMIAGSVLRVLREVHGTLSDVRREVVPLLRDAHGAVDQAHVALSKTDELLDTAQSIGGTVDSASKIGYRLFSNPAIKVMAIGSGVAKGARSVMALRKRS